jgi:hypothetical protein
MDFARYTGVYSFLLMSYSYRPLSVPYIIFFKNSTDAEVYMHPAVFNFYLLSSHSVGLARIFFFSSNISAVDQPIQVELKP